MKFLNIQCGENTIYKFEPVRASLCLRGGMKFEAQVGPDELGLVSDLVYELMEAQAEVDEACAEYKPGKVEIRVGYNPNDAYSDPQVPLVVTYQGMIEDELSECQLVVPLPAMLDFWDSHRAALEAKLAHLNERAKTGDCNAVADSHLMTMIVYGLKLAGGAHADFASSFRNWTAAKGLEGTISFPAHSSMAA